MQGEEYVHRENEIFHLKKKKRIIRKYLFGFNKYFLS